MVNSKTLDTGAERRLKYLWGLTANFVVFVVDQNILFNIVFNPVNSNLDVFGISEPNGTCS